MPVSERSEFRAFPIFCTAQTGTPQGRLRLGRLSLNSFFGDAKKEFRPPGRDPACIHEGQSLY